MSRNAKGQCSNMSKGRESVRQKENTEMGRAWRNSGEGFDFQPKSDRESLEGFELETDMIGLFFAVIFLVAGWYYTQNPDSLGFSSGFPLSCCVLRHITQPLPSLCFRHSFVKWDSVLSVLSTRFLTLQEAWHRVSIL